MQGNEGNITKTELINRLRVLLDESERQYHEMLCENIHAGEPLQRSLALKETIQLAGQLIDTTNKTCRYEFSRYHTYLPGTPADFIVWTCTNCHNELKTGRKRRITEEFNYCPICGLRILKEEAGEK